MKQLRCALYPRVSTEEQFINGLSLPAQIKDLTEYAERMGYHIVGTYADEGVSARKPVSKRPALLRLLHDVEDGKIDIILVTKLDRWFRNIKEYQTTQEILERHHCYWKTIFEDYDTSTANGQMVVNIMLAVAQNECDRTSERIKVVLEHKIRNGEHVTGAAPYGYVSVNKKLQKDPETECIVNEIFDFYFSCFSKHKTVAHIMNRYGDHPRRPTVYQVNRVLSTELYTGIYRGMPGFYPAYITKEQFDMIKNTSDTKTYPHTAEPYIFSGLITCPACGRVLTGFRKKNTCKDGSFTFYKRYRCSAKYDKHRSPCITEKVIEEYMLDHLCPSVTNVIATLQNRDTAKISKAPAIRAEMDRLNILFQKGRVTAEYYDSQYTALEKDLRKESEDTRAYDLEKYKKLREEISGDWRELYEMLDAAHKNAFWKRIVKEIHVDKDTHKISGFSFV